MFARRDKPLVNDIVSVVRGERVYPMQEATRVDVQALGWIASVRSEYPTCSNKRWYASTKQLSI